MRTRLPLPEVFRKLLREGFLRDLPEDPFEDHTVGRNDVRRRQSDRVVGMIDGPVIIESDCVGNGDLIEERLGVCSSVLHSDTDERYVRELFGCGVDSRHLLSARETPRRPEVQEQRPAVVGEIL